MAQPGTRRRKRFELLGGELCLDLINTVGWRSTPRQIEFIPGWSDLLAWVEQAAYLTGPRLERISSAIASSPRRGPALLARARKLREAMHRIFDALIHRRAIPGPDLEVLNRYLRPGMARMRLARLKAGFQWQTPSAGSPADDILWPIARSAADLLTSGRWDRVRVCGDGDCGWVFLDTTRNRRRAWCAMRICGNRHKARRRRASLKVAS